MATSAIISDVFYIYLTTDAATGHVVTNPGRAFKVTSIRAYNAGGTPNITVAKSGGGDIAATQPTLTNAWKDLTITVGANQLVPANENLTVTNAATSTTQVIVECVANAGYTLSVT